MAEERYQKIEPDEYYDEEGTDRPRAKREPNYALRLLLFFSVLILIICGGSMIPFLLYSTADPVPTPTLIPIETATLLPPTPAPLTDAPTPELEAQVREQIYEQVVAEATLEAQMSWTPIPQTLMRMAHDLR